MTALYRLCTIAWCTFVAVAFTACGGSSNKGDAHMAKSAPVLLFNGTGISPNDVTAMETILNGKHIKYFVVNSSELNEMNFSQIMKYRLLIVPGGDFIAMGNSLTAGTATNIRHAVQHGLNYLGVCAGGFLAGYSKYYNGFNLTSGVTFGFYSAENEGIHKAAVPIASAGTPTLTQYWEDGPQLSGWGAVVARYPDGTPAVTEGKCGGGFVLLAGIHPEAPASWRRGLVFNTPANADNAYAATLIHASLTGELLPHY
jgi:glutamine amidotransferase-like uncharacterized protein